MILPLSLLRKYVCSPAPNTSPRFKQRTKKKMCPCSLPPLREKFPDLPSSFRDLVYFSGDCGCGSCGCVGVGGDDSGSDGGG